MYIPGLYLRVVYMPSMYLRVVYMPSMYLRVWCTLLYLRVWCTLLYLREYPRWEACRRGIPRVGGMQERYTQGV